MASRVEELSEAAWTHIEAGRAAEAGHLFQQLLQLEPRNAEAWMMLGVVHAETGDNEQALDCLRRAQEVDPDYPDPYLHMARLQLDSEQTNAALISARKAVECDSGYQEAWQLLGEICARGGDTTNAERAYRQLLNLDPGRADIHNRLGSILAAMRRFDEGILACNNALKLEPENPEIFANLGNVYFDQGNYLKAVDSFQRALQLSPDFAGARFNLGNTLRVMGDFQQAVDCYRQLLDSHPGSVEARLSLGDCYLKSGEFSLALASYDEVLAAVPGLAIALLNKGFALTSLERYPEALEVFSQLLEANRQHADAWFNRGLVEKKLGLFDEAGGSLSQALTLSPDNQDIRLSLSLLELLRGNFETGWRYYSSRKSVRGTATANPADLAGDLSGKRILLIKDQGIGDEIFFLRFAQLLKDRGAWLACQTDPKIRSIVARIPFLDQVVTESDEQPAVDLRLSVGDLPYLLGLNDVAAFPPPATLSVLPEASSRLDDMLAGVEPGPLVGVTWWAGTRQQGNTLGDQLAHREAPLKLLAELLRPVRATVVILQRNPDLQELETFRGVLGRELIDMSELNDDLETMLALLSRLDDYIGVDNTNMHLSAGIGKSCRILVPHPPEWRMLMSGSMSHWFPGFTLYRQSADGDWGRGMMQLENDIKADLSR